MGIQGLGFRVVQAFGVLGFRTYGFGGALVVDVRNQKGQASVKTVQDPMRFVMHIGGWATSL